MDQPGTLGYISGTILNTFSSLFNFSEKPMFNPLAGQNHCLSTHLTRHFEMFSSQKTCTIGSYQLCEGCSVCLSRESHSVYSFYTFYVKCSPMFQVHVYSNPQVSYTKSRVFLLSTSNGFIIRRSTYARE